MGTFVLVHGSHCGAWVWQKVTPLLREVGHEVYTPTLTGLADRSHLVPCAVNLTTHITDVINLLHYEDLAEVVLVGNSYSGMVITGVAAGVPERIKRLVYLDAYIPDDGQSEADLLPAPVRATREAEAAGHGGLIEPFPPAIFGITNPQLENWIKARLTPHPWGTYAEPVPAGNAKSAGLPRTYIHCTRYPETTPRLFDHFAHKARSAGWEVLELAATHLAMLTEPRELAELLLRLDLVEGL